MSPRVTTTQRLGNTASTVLITTEGIQANPTDSYMSINLCESSIIIRGIKLYFVKGLICLTTV